MAPSIRQRYHKVMFAISYRLHVWFGRDASHHYHKRDKAVLDELNPRRTHTEISQ